MGGKLIYAFRGWIAFVSFVDLSTAVRSYIEKRSFLNNTPDAAEFDNEKYTVSRVVGIYSVLKALALIHCTLFIHYKPVVSMGICSVITTLLLYLSETLYFRSANLNFLVTFPCMLNLITLVGLVYLPKRLKLWEPLLEIEENNFHIIKPSNALKRKRNHRKMN